MARTHQTNHLVSGAVYGNPNPQAGASIPGTVYANRDPYRVGVVGGTVNANNNPPQIAGAVSGGGVRANANPQLVSTGGLPTASALPASSLGQDPAFLAFMRQIGATQAELQGTAEDRLNAINNELQRRLPDIAFAGELGRKGISGQLEARGLLRSGELQQALADQRHSEALQTGQLIGTAGDQQNLIRNELGRRMAETQRQIAEQGLNSAGTITTSGR